MIHFNYWPLFYIYIIIKSTTWLIQPSTYTFAIDTQASIQKRKRADTVQNKHAIDSDTSNKTTIICDTSHLDRKPSNIEDNSDDSNVD